MTIILMPNNMTNKTTSGGYDYIFTTKDCMGKHVALKKGTFTEKILPKHSEISEDVIRKGVESAQIVMEDSDYKNRRRYYKMTPFQ